MKLDGHEPRGADADAALPIGPGQEPWWFLERLRPGTAANIAQALRLKGPLDVQALEKGLGELLQRHEPLRTTFQEQGGRPVQLVQPAPPVQLAPVELSGLPAPERERELRQRMAAEAGRPFELRQGPLIRFALYRLGPEEHVLLLAAHQISLDSASLAIFTRELAALYGAFREGRPSPLPALPLSYREHARRHRGQIEGGTLAGQFDYWSRRLAQAPVAIDLPMDHPPPAVRTLRTGRVGFALAAEQVSRLGALGLFAGTGLRDVLLAGFAALLGRYARQEDLIVGLPAPGRSGEAGALVGPLANVLPLRVDLAGDPPGRDLLEQVRETAQEAFAHQDVPAETAARLPDLQNRLSLIQVLFELDDGFEAPAMPGLELSRLALSRDNAWVDLALSLTPREDGGLDGGLEYSAELFSSGAIERMAAHYRVLLDGLAATPDARLSRLPLLTEEERQQVLRDWNDTRRDFPAEACVQHLFEAQAARTPDAVAVVMEGRHLTYGALDRSAGRLARRLRALGVGPESRVAVCMNPSLEAIVALYGTLKAGGAYVPLDPQAPFERLDFSLREAGVSVVLTQRAIAPTLPSAGRTLLELDPGWDAGPEEGGGASGPGAGPLNLAYIIFTSGSTGEPKGVLVPHRAVVNHNTAVARRFDLRPGDRMLQFTPLCFDAAGEEIYPPLLSGATIIIRGELVPTGEFRELIERERLTVLSLPPAYLHEWLSELDRQGLKLPSCLRLVLLGGEKLLPETWTLWQRVGGAQIPWINVYGPTEATVTSAMCEISGGGLEAPVLPIGGPVANARIHLLDAQLEPVPVGHPGELHIAGAGLARGYLNRPDQTAERFIPDPFSAEPDSRLYKTGDLARYLPDGRIEFLGRVDHQVKLRGFRVELGEIESTLRKHPGVQEAVVVVRGEPPAGPRLVAYVVPSRQPAPQVRELRAAAAERLPGYMVPSAFVVLESLPLTTNGKVDRKALPPPAEAAGELEQGTAPQGPIEEALAGIWCEVLGVQRVGAEDNFFELGGHSLSAMQVMSRVGETLGAELDLRQVFESPTLSAMAREISSRIPVRPDEAPQMDVNQLSEDQVDALLREMISRRG